MMWLKFFILPILFEILFASPPGLRDGTSDKSYKKHLNSQDGKNIQPSTSSSHLSKYKYGSEPQSMPLDLSITRNKQNDRYPAPSTPDKPFGCTKCGQKYGTMPSLENHDRTVHQGITFDCAKCGRKYYTKKGLELHDRAIHQAMRFDCAKCGRQYTTKENLVNHDRAEHQENSEIHKCDRCPYQTKNKKTLYNHKRTSH